MTSMNWETGQLAALRADLGKAGVETTRKAGQVVRKSAADTESAAKQQAPVDTGALRNSIGVTMQGPLSAEIGPTVSYGIFLEWGTHKMAAQPYMGPALDRIAPGFEAAMEQLGGEIL